MDGSNYITMGYNFLQLTVNTVEEMCLQGNKSLVTSCPTMSEEESWKNYDELTKWNDRNIGIPVLFNFFHGVELILKGLILHCEGSLEKKTHSLNGLLNKLKKTPNPPANNVIQHFSIILPKNGLEDFFTENEKTVDSFYELFKYPELKDGKVIIFKNLKGQEKIGLERFKKIKALASSVKEEIILWKKASNKIES